MSEADMKERADLQQLIFRNAEEFFQIECEEDLFILAQEVKPSDSVDDRIDLLAVDNRGKLVVIELKRGRDRLQLLQALSYAAMVADLEWDRLKTNVEETRQQGLNQFLGKHDLADTESEEGQGRINEFQRIVLIAESFDYEVLHTAKWLTEKYGMDIRCYEVALAHDPDSHLEYLSAVQLYPTKPLAEEARRVGALRSVAANEPRTIEKRLLECSNDLVKQYFQELLPQNPRRSQSGGSVIFPPQGEIRLRVSPRKDYVRVKQIGRFEGDEDRWRGLSYPPRKVRNETNLILRLRSSSDIDAFRQFVDSDLAKAQWRELSADLAGEDGDEVDKE
jgi:hypothetical protein